MKFHYEAFDGAGNLVEGSLDAVSESEARELVSARGATPYLVRSAPASDILFRDFGRATSSRRASDSQLARLARDLAVLLEAGLPLDASLRMAATTAEDAKARELALRLLEGVVAGHALPDVMERMGAFRSEYVQVVQAGEMSADYGTAMRELAELLDRRLEVRGRIRSAMAYPALLVVLAAVSVWIILGLLVPAVTPIFLENGMPLPAVIAAMEAVRSNAGWVLASGVMVVACWSHRPCWRGGTRRRASSWTGSTCPVPVIGAISGLREAARFTRTLATLIRAGAAPLQALEASWPLVRNLHMKDRLAAAIADVRAGVSIGTAMARTAALPPIAQQIIAVGEESGRLQEMLVRVTAIMERQEQARTARIVAVITPAVTLLVAGMVAGIILSVVGAILSVERAGVAMNRRSGEAGFALLEVLAILIVLGLVAGMAMPLLRRTPAQPQLKAEVTRMADALRVTRAAAMAQNRDTVFHIEPVERAYGSQVIARSVMDDRIEMGLSVASANARSAVAPSVSFRTAGRPAATCILSWMGRRRASASCGRRGTFSSVTDAAPV